MGFMILVLTGFVLTFTAPWIRRRLRKWSLPVFLVYPLAALALLWNISETIQKQSAIAVSLPWVPSLGVNLSLRIDGLGWLFGLLISGIGALVIVYAHGYLHHHPQENRFYGFLFLFMTAMLGVVWSEDIFLLFVFWELTSISSFLLIGLEHPEEKARKAALQALLVTAGGGLALLAGLVGLTLITGSSNLSVMNTLNGKIVQSELYLPVLLLILAGAFTKSAQFPFHFWLPGAMAAPTPVSAYLHSATMVKAGVYLLARLTPALGGTPQWHTLLTLFGLATLLAGAFLALGQTDLKRLLAYTTVASLGTMVFLIGLGDSLAIKSAITLILAHALYKGALFFVAGGIDHSAHTRDLNRLGGLAGTMPFTAFAAVLAGLSMLGLPPALGFISKELVYEAALESASGGNTLIALIALSGVTAVGIWVAFLPFWKKPDEQTARGHGEEITLWLPPVLLGLISLGLGLLPGIASKALVQPAVEAVLLKSTPVKLALWHGFTPMLALSGLTLAIGTVLALNRMRFQPAVQTILQTLAPISPERGYERGLTGLKHFAALQTNFLQNGYFRRYLMVTILSGILLVGIVLLQSDSLPWTSFTPPRFYEVILVGVILTGVFTVTRTSSRMAAAALLGMMGFTIALIYLLYSAPDLAMVQFTIETLSVILFVLVIYRLPQFTRTRGGPPAVLDVVVSVAAGVLVTVLVLTLSAVPHDSLVTSFYAENSLKLAQGRNVVNVILVDFRGFDTLGEITVLALAGIGVFALLKLSGKTEAIRTSSQEETK